MKCQFDSSPPPVIRWIKTTQDFNNKQIIVDDNDLQVIDILTKQIGPTIYETQLTVDLFY
jgi:hypothetical protein